MSKIKLLIDKIWDISCSIENDYPNIDEESSKLKIYCKFISYLNKINCQYSVRFKDDGRRFIHISRLPAPGSFKFFI